MNSYSFLKIGITYSHGVPPEILWERVSSFLPDAIVLLDESNYLARLLQTLGAGKFVIEVLEDEGSLEALTN